MVPTRATLGHQPALDGLRGLAVAAVVAYHLGQANDLGALRDVSGGGFLGVSAFLTLSGFLITSLLILEYESIGHVSLGGFWSRRLRRLMPAALVTLAAIAVLTPLIGTESQLSDLPAEIWSTLAYVVNWRFIAAGSDYAAVFTGAPSPIRHFWSLAVEEQCYFVLPFAVAVSLRFGAQRRRVIAVVFAVIATASTMAMILIGGGGYSNRVYLGTDTRAAELAIGALLAVAVTGRTRVKTDQALAITSVAGPVALGLIVVSWATTSLQSSWLYRGGLALHAVGVAVVIFAALQPRTPLQRVLSFAPLTALGKISYGVYLIHWPVLWWLSADRLHLPALAAVIVQVAVTLGLATASYRYLEQPVRSGTLVVARQRIYVPLGAIIALALVAFVLPAPDDSKLVALGSSGEAVIPTTEVPAPGDTAPPPPVRVIVIGDSFALSVGYGLEDRALETGDIATLNSSIVGCGFGRGGMNQGIGLEREWTDECKDREQTLENQIAVFQPDVALLAGGMWDITERKLEGETVWTHIGEPGYDAYLVKELRHLTDFLTDRGIAVVWTTSPRFEPQYNPLTYMDKPPYFEAEEGRSDRFNEVLVEAMAERPAAHIIDLAKWMRDSPGGELNPALRIDGVHFTRESTDTLSEWLGPQLVTIGREAQPVPATTSTSVPG